MLTCTSRRNERALVLCENSISLNSCSVEWYVNFADADLFTAYHIGLFAQDEIQTAEHPACGAIKEWMNAVGKEDKVRLQDPLFFFVLL